MLTQKLFFLSVISSALSIRAEYLSWSFDGVTSTIIADGVSVTVLDFKKSSYGHVLFSLHPEPIHEGKHMAYSMKVSCI